MTGSLDKKELSSVSSMRFYLLSSLEDFKYSFVVRLHQVPFIFYFLFFFTIYAFLLGNNN